MTSIERRIGRLVDEVIAEDWAEPNNRDSARHADETQEERIAEGPDPVKGSARW